MYLDTNPKMFIIYVRLCFIKCFIDLKADIKKNKNPFLKLFMSIFQSHIKLLEKNINVCN